MALLVPLEQRFLDLRDGTTLCVTRVKLVSTSDTITVPEPAHQTTTAAVGRVLARSAAAASVAQTGGTNTVTITGTAGNEVVVCTLHFTGNSLTEA